MEGTTNNYAVLGPFFSCVWPFMVAAIIALILGLFGMGKEKPNAGGDNINRKAAKDGIAGHDNFKANVAVEKGYNAAITGRNSVRGVIHIYKDDGDYGLEEAALKNLNGHGGNRITVHKHDKNRYDL
jgi:hypothetical protein